MTILSDEFYSNLEQITESGLEDINNIEILEEIDWETEGINCFEHLMSYFDNYDIEKLQNLDSGKYQILDIIWEKTTGNIELCFFDQIDIDNNSPKYTPELVIDNSDFFDVYFEISNNNFSSIGKDYNQIAKIFFHMISDLIDKIVETSEFQRIPHKIPYQIRFVSPTLEKLLIWEGKSVI